MGHQGQDLLGFETAAGKKNEPHATVDPIPGNEKKERAAAAKSAKPTGLLARRKLEKFAVKSFDGKVERA